jgi:nucleotide-binding universal stress UspA family protein
MALEILLPSDLSEEGLRPFAIVADLARRLGARITLLHVVEDLGVAPLGIPLAQPLQVIPTAQEIARARERLTEERRRLGEGSSVAIEVITAGDVAHAIVDHARSHGMGLIAMSTHGRTGFRRMVMGSVAEVVLRHSRVPVLIFPRHE